MRLKTIFLLLLCFCFAAGELNAEEAKKRRKKRKKKGKVTAFKQGQVGGQVGGGVLVKTDYSKSDYSIYGENSFDKGFPFFFRAEFGATEFLGIGVWYGMYKEDVTISDLTVPENVYGYKHKFSQVCLRPAFHVPLGMAKLDPYAGLLIGYNTVKATPFGTYNYVQEPLKGGMAWGIHGGANFYFTENIGVFVEGGYGKWLPMVNFGLAVKF